MTAGRSEKAGRGASLPARSYDWIAHHARVRPDKVACVDLGTGRSWTYRDLDDRVERLASMLDGEFGVSEGDRVAVYSSNDTNMFEVQFACWRLGAIFVPLNWRLALPELEFIVSDCAPSILVHHVDLAEQAAALASATAVKHRVCWHGTDAGAADYEDALASAVSPAPRAPTTLDSVLTIMYTSGTTGRPKGAIITHGMTFWNAISLVEFYGLGSDMVNLAAMPLFHTGGLNVFANPAFHFGGTNVVMDTFEPEQALRLLSGSEQRISHFLGVPAHWLFMSQAPGFVDASFPDLVAAGVAGSPTPVKLIKVWLDKGVALQQAFGMTETGPLVLALTKDQTVTKIGSAGLPALHTECRIVDETGHDVERGVVGELWARGPNITPGYWNRPDATAESITDGWLHTGDAARQDDDGYYYIVDRWKDMYISGGENVYPAEVEDVLYQLPGVSEAAVIGVDDERWVEVGKAIVVLKEGAKLTAAEILRHCTGRLAKYKVPKSVVFIDTLPRTASGKVLKRELRAAFGQE